MKNVVFISPNFPTNYWQFCRELRNNGLNVLGIGEAPYDELTGELQDSLTEYYKVGSLENYDEVYRAVSVGITPPNSATTCCAPLCRFRARR